MNVLASVLLVWGTIITSGNRYVGTTTNHRLALFIFLARKVLPAAVTFARQPIATTCCLIRIIVARWYPRSALAWAKRLRVLSIQI
jgi:hypothetical protein